MMDMPNRYRMEEEYHLRNNPSFFDDEEFAVSPEAQTIDGRIRRLQKDVERIRETIENLSRDGRATD